MTISIYSQLYSEHSLHFHILVWYTNYLIMLFCSTLVSVLSLYLSRAENTYNSYFEQFLTPTTRAPPRPAPSVRVHGFESRISSYNKTWWNACRGISRPRPRIRAVHESRLSSRESSRVASHRSRIRVFANHCQSFSSHVSSYYGALGRVNVTKSVLKILK